MRNPNDSLTSTWRRWDRSQWNFIHWTVELLYVHHVDLDRPVPVHQKTDKVPYAPQSQFQIWVLLHALIPMALQQAYITYFGRNLSPLGAYGLYSLAVLLNADLQLNALRRAGHKYGFFDGDKHARDDVPDVGVWRAFRSLASVLALRPMMMIYLSYHVDQGPSSTNWLWLPLVIGLYAIVLDFWFYWYHRLMHATDSLWKYHRTHHLTKHPSPLLSSYADHEQEFFDVLGVPLMTYGAMKLLGIPFGFYDWWISTEFVIFTELLGHSGLRIQATAINPLDPLLRMLDMELVIEDHDLHHRKGWKKSHNYGKQTRIWDQIFGTTYPRVEGYNENVDYVNVAKIPFFYFNSREWKGEPRSGL